jgi:hypothetical protein
VARMARDTTSSLFISEEEEVGGAQSSSPMFARAPLQEPPWRKACNQPDAIDSSSNRCQSRPHPLGRCHVTSECYFFFMQLLLLYCARVRLCHVHSTNVLYCFCMWLGVRVIERMRVAFLCGPVLCESVRVWAIECFSACAIMRVGECLIFCGLAVHVKVLFLLFCVC